MSFTAPCFSGECGFCSNCCDSNYKYKYKYPENIQRAYDLKKFMGKQKVQEETQDKKEEPQKETASKEDNKSKELSDTPKTDDGKEIENLEENNDKSKSEEKD